MSQPDAKRTLVNLDWHIETCWYIARNCISGVKSLHDETTMHFSDRKHQLNIDYEKLTPAQRAKDRGTGQTLEEHFEFSYEELRELQGLRDEACLIILYRIVEKFLRDVFAFLKDEGVFLPKARGLYLDDITNAFAKAGVDITKAPFDWKGITELKAMRNCLAHSGIVAEKDVEPLSHFDAKKDELIDVPAGYFEEAREMALCFGWLLIAEFQRVSKEGRLWTAPPSES
jgi:hypothetical protein